MIEEKQFGQMKYLLSYPENFDPQKKHPLVIFLHGAGTRSAETDILRRNTVFVQLQKEQSRGYVLLAPLCSVNNWNEVMQTLLELVDTVRRSDFIDITRVHLTGNSMGGYGTWELASERPDWFASIMPGCGGGIGWMADMLKDVPVRTFHGLLDTVVDPIESLQMAKAVNCAGGHCELILYPDLAHNCWDRMFADPANLDWLLQFTTLRDKSQVEKLSGEAFG